MKRYINSGNRIYTGIDSEEDLIAIQGIARQIMNSRGFDTSSWSFIKQFDVGYGKKGLQWDTPYGEANTVLDMGEWEHKGYVNCTFSLFVPEEFNHSFFNPDADTTWSSIAEEFLK